MEHCPIRYRKPVPEQFCTKLHDVRRARNQGTGFRRRFLVRVSLALQTFSVYFWKYRDDNYVRLPVML